MGRARVLLVRLVKPLVFRTVGFLLRRPRLKRMALALLDRMPRVQARLYAVVRQPDTVAPRRRHVPQTAADLSPLAARHYQALKQALADGKH